MAKIIVNLATSMVLTEIGNILATYLDYSYQQVSAASALRQKLLTYVLSRMPGLYTAIEECELLSDHLVDSCCSTEQRQQIIALIHQGIQQIGQDDALTLPEADPESHLISPSHWFG